MRHWIPSLLLVLWMVAAAAPDSKAHTDHKGETHEQDHRDFPIAPKKRRKQFRA
ncbi:MAG: hypothetical protein K2Q01_11405 [Rickettsiales bacterium]|nr:hypothetical protein [Rickettsiales bacterium]